jgi:hypothetical protein
MTRFWNLVDRSHGAASCWHWLGTRNRGGYGVFRIGSTLDGSRRKVSAHRFAWELEHGDPAAACVLHTCDNPACVNPDHLFLGTLRDNTQDMLRKGRNRPPRLQGSAHGRARLNENAVREIRGTTAAHRSNVELAERFGVCVGTIEQARYGKTWRHVQ